MVHAVKLAEEKSSLGNTKIIGSTFNKISKLKEKTSHIRFFVITKQQFSYYLTEDHYNYSEDTAMMRFYHSDIANIDFKVLSSDQTSDSDHKNKYHLTIYLSKCFKNNRNLTQQILKIGFSSYSSLT